MSTASVGVRAYVLGVASGGRSISGLARLSLHQTWPRPVKVLLVGAAAGEVVADKLPSTPSRLRPPVLASRVLAGALAGGLLARRDRVSPVLPALAGAIGAAKGSFAGAGFRARAGARRPDWQGALAEDAVVQLLTTFAVRPTVRLRSLR